MAPPPPPPPHQMHTHSISGIVKPVECISLHTTSLSLVLRVHLHALKDLNWHNAMKEEYNAHITNGTWVLFPRPRGENVVHSIWMFKHKLNVDKSLSPYEAKIVASTHNQ